MRNASHSPAPSCSRRASCSDEPLGALDLQLRQQMQVTLGSARDRGHLPLRHPRPGGSCRCRTDRLHARGRVQVDAPDDVPPPEQLTVADFVGKAVMLPVVERRDSMIVTDRLELPAAVVPHAPGVDEAERAVVVVRPEKLVLTPAAAASDDGPAMVGSVIDIAFKGGFSEVLVDVDGAEVAAHVGDVRLIAQLSPGDPVRVGFAPEDAWLCPVCA